MKYIEERIEELENRVRELENKQGAVGPFTPIGPAPPLPAKPPKPPKPLLPPKRWDGSWICGCGALVYPMQVHNCDYSRKVTW